MRQAFGCAVIIIHHCGVDATRPHGHTSLTGAADAQIAVKRDTKGIIKAKLEWLKDGEEGSEIYSRLERVEVGTDADGDPITSCVVVEADAPKANQEKRVTGQAKVMLDLLCRALDEAGETPHPSGPIPPDVRAVPLKLWRQLCYERVGGKPDNPGTKRRAFSRNNRKLQELGCIGVWEGWVWLTGQTGHRGTA